MSAPTSSALPSDVATAVAAEGLLLADELAGAVARALPSAPDGAGTEPAHAVALLAALAPPARPAPDPVPPVPAAPTRPLHHLGVAELLSAFAAGATTPSALLAALAPRWAADGPAPGAVLALVPGAAEAAAESDRRWAAGTARPLEGIPFGVKDIIDVAGAAVTCGSLLTGDRVATTDATAVARLRAAGAIPVVITATTEFACGAPHNARYGAVGNPWDPERWTGGSSTGSAAALAAGLVPVALGTDTGGSIRVPSAASGLTGIKPTYGLVPRTGVASLSWTLDHVGPMARDAADLALVLPHLAGPDGVDPAAGPPTPLAAELAESWSGRLDGLRVGLPSAWFTDVCDAAVLAAWRSEAAVLVGLGAALVELDLGDLAAAQSDTWVLLCCELASNQEQNLLRYDAFDAGTRLRIAKGLVPSAVDYLRALRNRPVHQRDALARLDEAGVDVLLTPGVGATAARLSDVTVEVDGQRLAMQPVVPRNTSVFDLLGFPAVMTPAGLAPDGMPVGVQVVGRPWAEALCLRVVAAHQGATGHHRAVPVPDRA